MGIQRTLSTTVAVLLLGMSSASAQTKWDLYSFVGISHPVAQQLKEFGDEVKKRTNGELVITVRPAGEFPFKPNEVVKITGDGHVQMGAALALFTTGSVPLTGVTGLPLFLRTEDEMMKALPIIRKHTAKDFEKAGVKVLFHYLWPEINLFGNGKPIHTPDQFTGRKFRTLSPQQAEMLKRLGAAAVSLTTPEVPVALERGTVEGVMTTSYNMIGSKWADLVKWAYIANFHGADDYIIVNIAAYNKLKPEVRKVLDEVAAAWAPKMTKANLAAEAGSLEELRTKHKIEVIRVSQEHTDAMMAKVKDYWIVWAQQNGPAATAMLNEIRSAVGK